MGKFEATQADWAALLRRRWWGTAAVAAIVVPFIVAILYFEYRLMIFAIIALAVLAVAMIEPIVLSRSTRRLGWCAVSWDDEAVTLRGTGEPVRLVLPAQPAAVQPIGTMTAPVRVDRSQLGLRVVRVQPDLVFIVEGINPRQWRQYAVPMTAEASTHFAEHVRLRGVPVQAEKAVALALAGLLFGVLASKLAGTAAAVLVLGALANFVMWGVNGSGSPKAGALLLAGALGLLTIVALIHAALGKTTAKPG